MSEKTMETNSAALFQEARERIIKLLWGLTGVKEGDRELAVKDILWEMEKLQKAVDEVQDRRSNADKIAKEENDLLRSLLGTDENELRARVLALAQELSHARKDLLGAQDELEALRKKTGDYASQNDELREKHKSAQGRLEDLEAQRSAGWLSQISGFSDEQARIQQQFAQLSAQMQGVQKLLGAQGEMMTREKQAELSNQQAKLLGEMATALTQKEDLLWAEEELFARGVAQKLRGELQAAQGRLQLALEKFHLLDENDGPKPKTWEQWWRLIKGGPDELRSSFRDATGDLHRAVETLEEYMALTHRRAPAQDDISLVDLVRERAATLYADRMNKGALEIISPGVLPTVKGDRDLLNNILQVLMDNAFEALPPEGGRVRVEALRSPDEKEVWLTVYDTGAGLTPSQREGLFQPFVSNKPGHRGLGLARARRWAEWHRGRVELINSTGNGTTFRLSLPA